VVKRLGEDLQVVMVACAVLLPSLSLGIPSFVVWFRTYGFVVADLFVAIVVQYLSLHMPAYADHSMNFIFGLFYVACL
jgi:hypothetical protein